MLFCVLIVRISYRCAFICTLSFVRNFQAKKQEVNEIFTSKSGLENVLEKDGFTIDKWQTNREREGSQNNKRTHLFRCKY